MIIFYLNSIKNVFPFLLLGALLTLTSCSKSEQPPEEEPSLVVGEWSTEKIEIKGIKTETVNSESVVTNYQGRTGSEEDPTIIFDEDNTYYREDSFTISFIHMVDQNNWIDYTIFPFEIINGTYSVTDDKVKIISGEPSVPYGPLDPRNSFEWTIMELTENRMVLFTEKQETSNVDGVEIHNEFEIIQTFSR